MIHYHHGSCDACGNRFVVVAHFNYGSGKGFRICGKCIANANYMLQKRNE
jgi:hydrogenase maturation factor HypF (carbamoyltransferase family)